MVDCLGVVASWQNLLAIPCSMAHHSPLATRHCLDGPLAEGIDDLDPVGTGVQPWEHIVPFLVGRGRGILAGLCADRGLLELEFALRCAMETRLRSKSQRDRLGVIENQTPTVRPSASWGTILRR
jgi:hypothetical protein